MTVRPDTNTLTPLLQFNDVAFGISRIDHAKGTNAIDFCCSNLSDGGTASRNHRLQCLVHIVNGTCNVSEPALVREGHAAINEFVIAENLERRAVLAIARQTQVHARKMCVRDLWARIRIPRSRSEPIFSNLWQSDLCERTWRGLALFCPSVKFPILTPYLVYADECSGNRIEMLLSQPDDRILPRRLLSNRSGRCRPAQCLR